MKNNLFSFTYKIIIFLSFSLLVTCKTNKEKIINKSNKNISSKNSTIKNANLNYLKKIPLLPNVPPSQEFKQKGLISCAWVLIPYKKHKGYKFVVRHDILGNESGAIINDYLLPWSGVIPCMKHKPFIGAKVMVAFNDNFYGIVEQLKNNKALIKRLWRFQEKKVWVPISNVWVLKPELAPLSLVFFKLNKKWYRGTVVFLNKKIVIVKRRVDQKLFNIINKLEFFKFPVLDPIKIGTKVLAFRSWGTNLAKGVISKELIPSLLYEIRFSNVTRNVAWWGITIP